jgi:hypothetical protein
MESVQLEHESVTQLVLIGLRGWSGRRAETLE